MVTGGHDGFNGNVPRALDTTEIYFGTNWRIVAGKLPTATYHIKLTYIDNRILSFGKNKIFSVINHLTFI